MSTNNKTAIITGASSGIGAATARLLSTKGVGVVLVARRADRLDSLAREITQNGGKAHVLSADLCSEPERVRIHTEVQEQLGGADILINNAGLGWYGYAAEMPWHQAIELLRVNVEAVVQLSLIFLRDMKVRGRGHIINVGSIAGSIPSQGVAIYGATKSFLDNFSTAVHRELRGTELHMSVVRAGPVLTEFCENAAQRTNGRHLPTERLGVSAEKVAQRIWSVIRRPQRVIYVPRILRIVPWIELGFGWMIDLLGPMLLKKQVQYHKPD